MKPRKKTPISQKVASSSQQTPEPPFTSHNSTLTVTPQLHQFPHRNFHQDVSSSYPHSSKLCPNLRMTDRTESESQLPVLPDLHVYSRQARETSAWSATSEHDSLASPTTVQAPHAPLSSTHQASIQQNPVLSSVSSDEAPTFAGISTISVTCPSLG